MISAGGESLGQVPRGADARSRAWPIRRENSLSIARVACLASLAMLTSLSQLAEHANREGAGMAAAKGAIKGFFHIFTADHLFTHARNRPEETPYHLVTILDVLEPQRPRR